MKRLKPSKSSTSRSNFVTCLWAVVIAVAVELVRRSELGDKLAAWNSALAPFLWLGMIGVFSYIFIPQGIRFLTTAYKGYIDAGPLTPAQIMDIVELSDADEHQYVVTFVGDAQQDALGFTQVFQGKPRYAKGDGIDIIIGARQPEFHRETRPTYDVKLWDGKTYAQEILSQKIAGWTMIGIPSIFIVGTIIFALMWLF